MNKFLYPSLSIAILRMLMGLVFMAHGLARLIKYTLPGFGEFLNSQGLPGGLYLAWGVTIFETVFGLCMFLGYFVRIFCIGEILILTGGIIMVHWQNGWFVVGMTLGGIEYSIVLIIILISIFISYSKSFSQRTPRETTD
jgi:putative oxidoreductase